MVEHQSTREPSRKTYRKGCRCARCITANRATLRVLAKRWQAAHPERSREYARQWRERHPEKAKEVAKRYQKTPKGRATQKRFRINHSDRVKELCRKWYDKTDKEKYKCRKRRWYAEHPDKIQEYRQRYKSTRDAYYQTERGRRVKRSRWLAYYARKNNAKGTCSTAQLTARWAYYGNRCYLCGKDATTTDHVIPLNKGGTHWPSNLRPACKPCNSGKSDMPLSEFRRRIRQH